MKIISYSLFGAKNDDKYDCFEFVCYLRNFYFNVMMNKLIYPEWRTMLNVDYVTYKKYKWLLHELIFRNNLLSKIWGCDNLCMSMLWRMSPIFDNSEIVLCRDSDALTSYREAQTVAEWVESGLAVHSIHDNTAHNVPLMGGMTGFRSAPIKAKYESWEKMIALSRVKIDKRGTDQEFLNQVYDDFSGSMMMHNFKGFSFDCAQYRTTVTERAMPGVSKKLWTSDLCSSFIGAAGCNEMETLRFLKSNIPDFSKDEDLWNRWPQVFWWAPSPSKYSYKNFNEV